MKCRFCNSRNLEILNSSLVCVRNYDAPSPPPLYLKGKMFLTSEKYFCVDCGSVFEMINENVLSEYKAVLENVTDRTTIEEEI